MFGGNKNPDDNNKPVEKNIFGNASPQKESFKISQSGQNPFALFSRNETSLFPNQNESGNFSKPNFEKIQVTNLFGKSSESAPLFSNSLYTNKTQYNAQFRMLDPAFHPVASAASLFNPPSSKSLFSKPPGEIMEPKSIFSSSRLNLKTKQTSDTLLENQSNVPTGLFKMTGENKSDSEEKTVKKTEIKTGFFKAKRKTSRKDSNSPDASDSTETGRQRKLARSFKSSHKDPDRQSPVTPPASSLLQVSPEEIRKITTIIIKPVPKELNDKNFLKNHFSKFGTVKHVKCNPKKGHALVSFTNHDSAAEAKKNGRVLSSGDNSTFIFWSGLNKDKMKAMPSTSIKDKIKRDIDEELKSMGGENIEPFRSSPRISSPLQTPDPSLKTAPTVPKNKKVDQSAKEALKSLLQSVGNTNNERYRILDARDKLLRMDLTKQSDLATAKAAKGTCPDLCPEKERYCRVDQNSISSYETIQSENGSKVMDHKSVLKEYSRSSADQEEPLPHELRPTEILIKTMDHLVCNILDHPHSRKESNLVGEWFDFIWNRTRAIRKDITQQHLCNPECVSLVERCARFHIHCSAMLCEEDVMIFDPKINNENLTKCLQTLKHFYPDLEERGIVCPKEAEFRSYDILLNLNDSLIASQVQQLRTDIRKSPQVDFACQVFDAFSSNNYVRFFRLIRKAPYLDACIAHRYFVQVRTKAIRAILKAYRQPNHTELFRLEELRVSLAFEGINETKEFCEWLQLQVEGEHVLLNKQSVSTPTTSAPVIRARHLIESKRNCSVGEIIQGGSLPSNPYPNYIPHNSFDENGRLRPEAFSGMDQGRTDVVDSITSQPNPVPFPLTPMLPMRDSNQPAQKNPTIVISPPSLFGKQEPKPNVTPVSSGMFKFKPSSAAPTGLFGQPSAKPSSDIFGQKLQKTVPSLFGSTTPSLNVPQNSFGTPIPPMIAVTSEKTASTQSLFSQPAPKSIFSAFFPSTSTTITSVNIPSTIPSFVTPETISIESEVVQTIVQPEIEIKVPTPEELAELAKSIFTEIFFETIQSLLNKVVRDVVQDAFVYESATGLLLEATAEFMRNISRETINTAEIKQQEMELRERCAKILVEEIMEEMIKEEVIRAASMMREELRQKLIDSLSQDFFNKFVSEMVVMMCRELANETHKQELLWKQKVDGFLKHKSLQRSKKYFLKWHEICTKRKTLDLLRQTFPCGPLTNKIAHNYSNSETNSLLQNSTSEATTAKTLSSHLCVKLLSEELCWSPLDIPSLVGPGLNKKKEANTSFLTYKLAVLLPHNEQLVQPLTDWLTFKLGQLELCKDNSSGVKAQQVSYQNATNRFPIIGTSVLLLDSRLSSDQFRKLRNSQRLKGLSSIILLVDACSQNWRQNLKAQGEELFEALSCKPLNPPLPVAVILIKEKQDLDSDDISLTKSLNLDSLKQRQIISSYHTSTLFLTDSCASYTSHQVLTDAILLLSEQTLSPIRLKTSFLKDFLEDGLRKLVLEEIFEDLYRKRKEKKFHHMQAPDAIADLYNTAVLHLSWMSSKPELEEISWPASEFEDKFLCDKLGWNTRDNLNKLSSVIKDLKLSERCNEYLDPVNSESVCTFLREAMREELDLTIVSAVQSLLESGPAAYIPWSDIFVIILRQKMSGIHHREGNRVVAYQEKDFLHFERPEKWIEATKDCNCVPYSNPVVIKDKKRSLGPEISHPCKIRLVWDSKSNPKMEMTRNLSLHLGEAMAREVEESKEFSRLLARLSHEEEDLESIREHGALDSSLNLTQRRYSPPKRSPDKVNNLLKDMGNSSDSFQGIMDQLNTSIAAQKSSNVIFRKKLGSFFE